MGRVNGKFPFNEYRVSIWEDGRVLEIVILVARYCECT